MADRRLGPPREGQFASADGLRAKFLQLMAEGASLDQACAQCDMTRAAYMNWRKRHPSWAAKMDVARQGARSKGVKFDPNALPPAEPIKIDAESTFIEKRYAYFGFFSYWHHVQMIEAIETAPRGGVTLILLPPEHGKTSVVADYCSDRIGSDPNVRIAYISEGLGLARKAVGKQQRRLEPGNASQFARFHAAYGPFHEEGHDTRPWTKDFFTVMGATHDEQDYTFEARGWTSAIAGSRVDVLIVDDIQSLRSLNATDQMVETFRQDFLSRVGKDGKVVIIGTRVGERDFYDALIKADLVDRLVMLPATEGKLVECPLGDKCDLPHIPHEEPLCPEMWPVHDLARKRKQVGESAWWRNYQQKPRNSVDATFSESMVAGARNPMETLITVRDRVQGWRRFAGLDPAVGGGNTLIGAEANGQRIRLLGVSRNFNMVRTENILNDIELHFKLWKFTDLIVEVNAFQKALGEDERLRNLSRFYGFRIHQHTTGSNKLDPELGVASMAGTFSEGLVDWPYGDEASMVEFAVLEAELLAWRGNVPTRKLRQDTVMALWFCWLWWQKRRRQWLEEDAKISRILKTGGVPWPVRGYEAIQAAARAFR